MQIEFWTRLSWWQRTRLAMLSTVSAGTLLSVLIAVLIVSLDGSDNLNSLSWLAFTAFPLLAVIIIASLARLQERIDIRAPSGHDDELANRGRGST